MRILAAIIFLTGLVPAKAQELPANTDLAMRVAEKIPAWWMMLDYRTIASASTGDPITPMARIRFEADVAPRADLFSSTGEAIGPFEVIVRTMEKNAPRTLYGAMELTYSAGTWSGSPKIENPIDGLGQPVDAFTRPTLELGSERQAEVFADIRDNAISAAEAELSAQLQKLSAEYQARIDETTASNEALLTELQRKLEARRADLRRQADALQARHEAEIAAMKAEYAARIEALKQENSPEIARLEEALKLELDNVRAGNEAALEALRADQSAKIEALNQAHAQAVGELKARQAQELAFLAKGFEEKRERLKREIAQADDIIAMQEQVIERLRTIQDNELYSEELVSQKRDERIAFFKRYAKGLTGVVNCWEADRGRPLSSNTLGFATNRVMANGLFGDVSIDGITVPASLTLTGDFNAAPRKFVFAIQLDSSTQGRLKMAKSFPVSSDQAGILSGSLTDSFGYGTVQCEISLAY